MITTFLLPLALIPAAFAAPAEPIAKRAVAPIYSGAAVSGRTYDYVIAGGGLAGVVLASRLTEDAGRTVLVIEAGYDEEGRQDVTDASRYQSTFDTFLDWQYQTVPQASANNQPAKIRGGRALGGSTVINGLAWSKPHDYQIDAMETVGNTGLNWNSLQPYMRRAESFQAPSSAQRAAGVTYDPSCHGSGGPIGVQYDPNASPNAIERNFNTTIKNLGTPYAGDLTCGNPAGLAPIANTRSGNTRIDAYRGYLFNRNIPNLTILAGASVGKVLLTSGSNPRATGLEFRDEKGATYSVSASREVIMATGSIKTPVILQQSGIGPTSVLNSAGVTPRVDLPVGLNLIDQTTTTTNWNFNGNRGGGQPIVFPRFQDLFSGSDASRMRTLLQNNIAQWAQSAVNNGAAASAAGLQRVFEIQRDWILNKGVGFSENFDYTFSSTFGWDSWFLLPFSRGSVKITNNQPYSGGFNIDPRYYSNEFDRLAQGATARYSSIIMGSSPISSSITGKSGSQPDGTDLNAWSSWAQYNYRSNWHPIGTVAMMSKDLGGCVDSRNRVYGVSGLRVVDGSTLPFQVSSHLMSVLYGLAERAAEFIRADNAGTNPPASSSVPPTPSSSRPPTSSSSTPPSTSGQVIHPNGDNSKCLQVRDSSYTNGAAIEIANCNNAANQRFIFSRNGATSVKVANANFCLDAGTGPANGVKMKIWQCYSGLAAQTWNYGSDNHIKLASANQCLDLTDGNKNPGNQVQIWECSATNGNQVWTN